MKEYNKLTKELLSAGYTAEHFPDYVQIDSSRLPGDDPLHNMSGGFEYKRWYIDKLVYKTGCGKYVMGRNVMSDMSYKGVQWIHENDCPVIRCPYDKSECDKNNHLLHGTHGGGLSIQCWCVCHRTEESYDYENSIEKANKKREEERERKYNEYSKAHGERICSNHMLYNERTREWKQDYDPGRCANLKCIGFCPILGRNLDKQKGNVYYDIKSTYRRYDLDGTLFEGQVDTEITKGKRMFNSPVSMDICRNYVKLCKDDLIWHVNMKYHAELFFAEYHGREFKVEVLNIRAEQKESRDLLQDLQDIKDGIRIYHASDDIRREKEAKSQRRKEAQEKRIQKLEKKLLEVGYESLDEFSLDRRHADKWLTEERLAELEEMRQQRILEEQKKPVQINLFDFMEE